jgi:hypothetical protein
MGKPDQIIVYKGGKKVMTVEQYQVGPDWIGRRHTVAINVTEKFQIISFRSELRDPSAKGAKK